MAPTWSPWLASALAVLAATLIGLWAWRRWHDRRRRMDRQLRSISYEMLRDILVPDGMGGDIHVDYLLLNEKGLLVLDVKDVPGLIFGSDRMEKWTVMDGEQRYSFANPQGPLYDRVAAVRGLVGDVPVEGRIVFTRRGQFAKGQPRDVTMIDALVADYRLSVGETTGRVYAAFRPAWETLKAQVRTG